MTALFHQKANVAIPLWNAGSMNLSGISRCFARPRWTNARLRASKAGLPSRSSRSERRLVPTEGFEPPTPRLRSGCSTAELRRLELGHCYRRWICVGKQYGRPRISPKQLPDALPGVAQRQRRRRGRLRHRIAIETEIRPRIVRRMHQRDHRLDRLGFGCRVSATGSRRRPNRGFRRRLGLYLQGGRRGFAAAAPSRSPAG